MVDDPNRSIDKQGGTAQSNKSKSDLSAVTTNPEANEPAKQKNRAYKLVKSAQEWMHFMAWPWITNKGLPRVWDVLKSSSFWTALATVVIAVATVKYTKYARKQWQVMDFQLKEMQKQLPELQKSTAAAQQSANTATAQLETTDRPWIKAVPQGWSPVTFDKGGLSFNVTFALTNVGRSVATDVTIYQGAVVPGWEGRKYFEEPIERQMELCKKNQFAGLTFSLFPGESKQLNVGVAISPEEMEKNIVPRPPGMSKPEVPPGKRIDPILFGCVDYRFASLPKHHQTGFIYSLVRIDPETPNVPGLIIIGMNLPPNRVNLERWMFGGDYAN